MGIDCRYCHTSVETAAGAGMPPTKTCMNCHSQIWKDSPDAGARARELPQRHVDRVDASVNDLPDFVYFNHSAHVNKGVGCTTCHGRVDQMPLMYPGASRCTMEWCLDCHRNPERYLRPQEEVFNVAWEPPGEPGRAGPEAGRRVRHQHAHQLLDLPPMSSRRACTPVSRRPAPPARRAPTGEQFWRASRSSPGSPAFVEYLHREFPERASEWHDPEGRREFLKVMGASLALAGLRRACTRQPEEKIVPYVRRPRRSSRAGRSSSPPR